MPLIPTPGFFQKKAEFYKQLEQLLANGIPPLQAFKTFSNLNYKAKDSRAFQKKIDSIQSGEDFATALFVGAFPSKERLDKSLIDAGELSGRTTECLGFLDRYYQSVAKIYRTVLKRLTYPFLIIHVAAGILSMVNWFLSQFDTGVAVSKFLSIIIPLYLMIFGALFITFQNKLPFIRILFESIFSFIPLLNKALKSLYITRFTLAFDSMLTAGVPVKESLNQAAATVGSLSLAAQLSKCMDRLHSGGLVSNILEYCRFFPNSYLVSIAVAEQSGRIDETLRTLYRQNLEDSEARLQKFGGAFCWLIYLGFVLFMVISILKMYGAYFGQLDEILGIL